MTAPPTPPTVPTSRFVGLLAAARRYLTLGNLFLFVVLWWAGPRLLPHLGALVGVRSGPDAVPYPIAHVGTEAERRLLAER